MHSLLSPRFFIFGIFIQQLMPDTGKVPEVVREGGSYSSNAAADVIINVERDIIAKRTEWRV